MGVNKTNVHHIYWTLLQTYNCFIYEQHGGEEGNVGASELQDTGLETKLGV